MHSLFFICTTLSAISGAVPTSDLRVNGYGCTIDKAVDGVLVNGSVPIDTNPLSSWDAPKFSIFNSTVIEDWSFDAVSGDALSGVTIGFSRGTITGHPAAQRLNFFAVFPNGTMFYDFTYSDFSKIKQCGNSIIGTWKNVTAGSTWIFEASKDLKYAKITIDSPRIKGTYAIESQSPAFFPNGRLSGDPQGDIIFSPLLYWQETAAIGDIATDFSLDGSQLKFRGVGGRERNWMPLGWAKVTDGWHMARGMAGPYVYVIWTLDSKIDGRTYVDFVLIKNKKIIFQSASSTVSTVDKYGQYKLPTDGLIKGHYNDNNTAQGAEFVDPVTGDSWLFLMPYTQIVYTQRTGELTGYNGFLGKVTGGRVGGKQYQGLGTAQQYQFVA